MQELYAFSQTQLLAFALVLLRVSAFVVVWPLFSVFNVPQHVKVLFALSLTVVIFPLVGWQQVTHDLNSIQIIWLIMREVFIGVAMGFVTRGFFYGVSAAGEMISIALGLSSASLLNPAMSSQGTALEQFKTVLATLIFLGLNGHHQFLAGLIQSYQAIPLSNAAVHTYSAQFMAQFVQIVMLAGLKLCAPVMVAILILNLTMGFIGRAVPQINVLVMSLPVTIMAGFMVMLISLPLFNEQLGEILNQMTRELFISLKGW